MYFEAHLKCYLELMKRIYEVESYKAELSEKKYYGFLGARKYKKMLSYYRKINKEAIKELEELKLNLSYSRDSYAENSYNIFTRAIDLQIGGLGFSLASIDEKNPGYVDVAMNKSSEATKLFKELLQLLKQEKFLDDTKKNEEPK